MANPNWWRVDDNSNTSTTRDCTNHQMKEAINSMLFVDISSKLPSNDVSLCCMLWRKFEAQ